MFLVFETVDLIMNKDVPYRLCRVYLIKSSDYHKETDELRTGIKNIPCFNEFMVQNDADSLFRKEIEIQPPEIRNLELRIEECKSKHGPKWGQDLLDFKDRLEKTRAMFAAWDNLLMDFKARNGGTNERFYTDVVDDTTWVTCEIVNGGSWWTFGMATKTTRYRAKLSVVYDAYCKLGQCKNIGSIEQKVVALQREYCDEKGVSQMLVDVHEAFIIARILRAQQTCRMMEASSASTSIRKTN
jgi:hypothetical protein